MTDEYKAMSKKALIRECDRLQGLLRSVEWVSAVLVYMASPKAKFVIIDEGLMNHVKGKRVTAEKDVVNGTLKVSIE